MKFVLEIPEDFVPKDPSGVVHALRDALEFAEIPAAFEEGLEMARVLIEVSGGLITNIMADGEIRVNVIDHDNLEEPEELDEDMDLEDVKDFVLPDEVRTPEALDSYIEEVIGKYRKEMP